MNKNAAGVTRRTMSEQVYYRLKEEIISQLIPELKMGTKINEVELANRLNCSTTPVREALNMLRRDNLVVSNSFHSSEVVSFTQKDIEDIFTLREYLEVLAVRQAMPNMTEKDVQALRLIQERYGQVHETGDFSKMHNVNREFHDYILRCANNRILANLLHSLSDQTALLRAPTVQKRYGTDLTDGRMIAVEEHAGILEAIERGDWDQAPKAMEAHMSRLRRDVCFYYKNYGMESGVVQIQ